MNGLESNGYQSHIYLYNKGVSTTQENGSSLVYCCGKDAARMWLDYLMVPNNLLFFSSPHWCCQENVTLSLLAYVRCPSTALINERLT